MKYSGLTTLFIGLFFGYGVASARMVVKADSLELPASLSLPSLPDTLPAASVPLGNRHDYPEEKSDFPMWKGPFGPTWDSISAPYPDEVEWLRQAKFGLSGLRSTSQKVWTPFASGI